MSDTVTKPPPTQQQQQHEITSTPAISMLSSPSSHHCNDDVNHGDVDLRNHNGANSAPAPTQPSPAPLQLSPAAWSRFAEWLHCVCIVTFDLELGQAMELVYPAHGRLSEAERTNICYLAFPDSNSGCMGDTQFHVRLRVQPERPPDARLSAAHRRYNAACAARARADAGHFWGFVYFRQIRDARRPRGYFQKSLVLLTRLPFVHLFHELCAVIAPLYFDEATADAPPNSTSVPGGPLAVLDAACAQIAAWPPLAAGRPLQLHLLGTVWQTEIAARSSVYSGSSKVANSATDNNNGQQQRLQLTEQNEFTAPDDSSPLDDRQLQQHQQLQLHRVCAAQDVDIYRSLGDMLTHVHLLWELVLTGEPIVVMAGSPTDSAHMVESLTSLIAPLNYCAESRPYFTIHDSEFREFTQRSQGPPPIILGVTNPFFAKTLQRWPHTIRLSAGGGGGPDVGGATSAASAALSAVTQKLRKMKHHQQNQQQHSSGGDPSGAGSTASSAPANGSGGVRLFDQAPGLYTAYRPFLHKDAGGEAGRALKQIAAGRRTQRPSAVQSALLRRHLLQLTQSFMIPLERYIASLMPLQRDIQPFRAAPPLGCFRQDDFLDTLAIGGPQLTSSLRGDWPGLYTRFFRGANFKGWYDRRAAELQLAIGVLQMEALARADMNAWLHGRHEVELVDMVLRLKQKLLLSRGASGSLSATSPRRHRRNCSRHEVAAVNRQQRSANDKEADGCCSSSISSGDDDDDGGGGGDVNDDKYKSAHCGSAANSLGVLRVDVETGASTAAQRGQRPEDPHRTTRRQLRDHLRMVCARLPDDVRRIIDGDRCGFSSGGGDDVSAD